MKEVLRLLRLTLLLRAAVGLFSAVVTLISMSDARVLIFNLLATLPTLLVLAASFYVARRRPIGEREMRFLLAAAMLALACEVVFGAWYFQANLAAQFGDMRRVEPPHVADLRRLIRSPLEVPGFFSLILAMLGTWMSRGRWYRWAAAAVTANLAATLLLELIELVDGTVMRSPWGSLLGQSTVLLLVCYFVRSLADLERRRQAEIEAANRQLAEQAGVRERLATSRERVRLARDLHDTLAHSLAGVAVQLDAIGALAAAREDVQPEIVRARDAVRRGLKETRAAINDLRTTAVEDLGLAGALRRHIDSLAPTSHAQLSLAVDETGVYDSLSVDAADALFRIAQEAIRNAERHSNAASIRVALTQPDDAVELQVEDDGAGFDIGEVRAERYGMRGMRERAEMIGARLRIDSVIGKGTRVTATMPIPASLAASSK